MTATPVGAVAFVGDALRMRCMLPSSPAAFLMDAARCCRSARWSAFAFAMTSLSLEFAAGCALPPSLTATASSRPIFGEDLAALAASVFSFLSLDIMPTWNVLTLMKTCLYSHKFKLLYHSSRAISIAISCAFAKIAEFSQSARSVSGKTTVFLSVVFITEKLWRSVFSHTSTANGSYRPMVSSKTASRCVAIAGRIPRANLSFKIPLKTVDDRLELRRKREVIDRRGDEKQITRA